MLRSAGLDIRTWRQRRMQVPKALSISALLFRPYSVESPNDELTETEDGQERDLPLV